MFASPLTSRRSFISAKVRSGSFATKLLNCAPRSGSNRAFRPEKRCRASMSPVFFLCFSSFLTIPCDTRKRFATSSCVHFPSS